MIISRKNKAKNDKATDKLKLQAAEYALNYIEDDAVIGVGTGSTVNLFIQQLAKVKNKIAAAVASSIATEKLLKSLGIHVVDLNEIHQDLPIYIDGADEVNKYLQLIKGGGGALTREKIIANAAKKFVCIVDETKMVAVLGENYPLPVEVIPMARSMVAHEIVKLGGHPEYRNGFVTDNGNQILDVYHFPILEPMKIENTLNNIPGVVCNGLFALRGADELVVATQSGVKTVHSISEE